MQFRVSVRDYRVLLYQTYCKKDYLEIWVYSYIGICFMTFYFYQIFYFRIYTLFHDDGGNSHKWPNIGILMHHTTLASGITRRIKSKYVPDIT